MRPMQKSRVTLCEVSEVAVIPRFCG